MIKERKNSAKDLQNRIIEVITRQRKKSIPANQLVELLGLNKQDKVILLKELRKMLAEGILVKTDAGKFALPEKVGYITGVLDVNRKGFAFLRDLSNDNSEDIYVNRKNLANALHGDTVKVKLRKKRSKSRREGTVAGIIKRGAMRLVGSYHEAKGMKYFIPEDKRFPQNIRINSSSHKNLQHGDIVVAEITDWRLGSKIPRGVIVDYLGPGGSKQTEERKFLYNFNLPGDFPDKVINELQTLPSEEKIEELSRAQNREDLRHLLMVTIDDEEARDFDDAVSLQQNEQGYILGVHIADVSEYVREGKALDREALSRGTSVYLVDQVIHMLPRLLSENVCSLQAGKERLAVTVLIHLNDAGEVKDAEFFHSLIKVDKRLSYQQVEKYFSGNSKEANIKNDKIRKMLDDMLDLAEVIRSRRFSRGALDLDLPEARITVDGKGVPLTVEKRTQGRSENLIEEFMILCNEVVAEYLNNKKLPALYRIHSIPGEDKLALLRETLTLMGVKAATDMKIIKPHHVNQLLAKTKGEKTERLVSYLVLRSLPQARYSASNEGHYGLASSCYTHFTSPIRRYPDLVVHRILKQHLFKAGGIGEEKLKKLHKKLPVVADQASVRERLAIEAERALVDKKKAQYMAQKIGETFPGIISGVANFGLFVELDNTIEGMIPISGLDDDYYVYHEKRAALIGERTKKSFSLGDEVEIEVVRASYEEGKITFSLVK